MPSRDDAAAICWQKKVCPDKFAYLVEHECNHERPDNTRIGVDAQINSNEDGMEDDTRLQHDCSHPVLRMLSCKQLLLDFASSGKVGVCNLNICCMLSMRMSIYRLSAEPKLPTRKRYSRFAGQYLCLLQQKQATGVTSYRNCKSERMAASQGVHDWSL